VWGLTTRESRDELIQPTSRRRLTREGPRHDITGLPPTRDSNLDLWTHLPGVYLTLLVNAKAGSQVLGVR